MALQKWLQFSEMGGIRFAEKKLFAEKLQLKVLIKMQ